MRSFVQSFPIDDNIRGRDKAYNKFQTSWSSIRQRHERTCAEFPHVEHFCDGQGKAYSVRAYLVRRTAASILCTRLSLPALFEILVGCGSNEHVARNNATWSATSDRSRDRNRVETAAWILLDGRSSYGEHPHENERVVCIKARAVLRHVLPFDRTLDNGQYLMQSTPITR